MASYNQTTVVSEETFSISSPCATKHCPEWVACLLYLKQQHQYLVNEVLANVFTKPWVVCCPDDRFCRLQLQEYKAKEKAVLQKANQYLQSLTETERLLLHSVGLFEFIETVEMVELQWKELYQQFVQEMKDARKLQGTRRKVA